ncbi:hypothetical protein D3C78_1514960 [compost metagenome]
MGGELQQRSLDVSIGNRRLCRQMAHQPRQVKDFTACALRSGAGKERVAEQASKQASVHLATGRPATIGIVAVALLLVNPGVE